MFITFPDLPFQGESGGSQHAPVFIALLYTQARYISEEEKTFAVDAACSCPFTLIPAGLVALISKCQHPHFFEAFL